MLLNYIMNIIVSMICIYFCLVYVSNACIDQIGEQNDNWILTLSVLLSSTLIYNSKSTLGQDAITKLHYVTELTKRVKVKDTPRNEDGFEFFKYFPNFVWVVRDLTLKLVKEGKPITPDEYLWDALHQNQGTDSRFADFPTPNMCIARFFNAKKCFTFSMPVENWKHLQLLETLPDEKLDPVFLQQVEMFCKYIYKVSSSTVKGQPVKGEMFCHLVETYVNVIQSGEIPCVENAVKNMADRENAKAVEISFNLYEAHMNDALQESANIEEVLPKIHQDCVCVALEGFMSISVLDETQEYQCQLLEKMEQKYKEICSGNKKERGGDLAEGGRVMASERHNIRDNDQELVRIKSFAEHFYQLKPKLIQEKSNSINEKERRLHNKSKELERAIGSDEKDMLLQQINELKRHIEKEGNEMEQIQSGDSGFGRYLTAGKSILFSTIKGMVGGFQIGMLTGNPAFAAVGAIVGSFVGVTAGTISYILSD